MRYAITFSWGAETMSSNTSSLRDRLIRNLDDTPKQRRVRGDKYDIDILPSMNGGDSYRV